MFRMIFYSLVGCLSLNLSADEGTRLKELNTYWEEVSRTVNEGDFEDYKATCHPDGILIAGSKKTSYLLSEALKKWKANFTKTKNGTLKASVEFRFSRRWGDDKTAHETGMFRYTETNQQGITSVDYIHLIALLVKKDGKWKIMMENQASKGTIEDWHKLKKL